MNKVTQADDNDFEGYKNFSFLDRGVKIILQGKWMVANTPAGEHANSEPFGKRAFTIISIVHPKDKPIPTSIKNYLGKFKINIKEITPEGAPLYDGSTDSYEASEGDKKIIYAFDNRDFIKEFTSSLGFKYEEKTEISFPFAGIQVKASSSLISTNQGAHLLVDYGDLYGEAISSIRNTGLNVLQIRREMKQEFIAGELLKGLNVQYSNTSDFVAVDRPDNLTISIGIPGMNYKTDKGEECLITPALTDENLVCFLNKKGYKIIILYPRPQTAIPSLESQSFNPN
jgi:hypothetical protein